MLDVIQCPKCKRSLHLSDASWRQDAHCPTCGERITLDTELEEPLRQEAPERPMQPVALGPLDAEVEIVPIKLSLYDQPARRVQRVPPPPPPLRLVPVAPKTYVAQNRDPALDDDTMRPSRQRTDD